MKQKENLTVDIKVSPAKCDFEFSTLSIRRYGKRQRVKPLRDTKELFKHLYESVSYTHLTLPTTPYV